MSSAPPFLYSFSAACRSGSERRSDCVCSWAWASCKSCSWSRSAARSHSLIPDLSTAVCCTVRTVLSGAVNSKDVTWDIVANVAWRLPEVNIGIVCANAPALRPLYLFFQGRLASQRTPSRTAPYSRNQILPSNAARVSVLFRSLHSPFLLQQTVTNPISSADFSFLFTTDRRATAASRRTREIRSSGTRAMVTPPKPPSRSRWVWRGSARRTMQ